MDRDYEHPHITEYNRKGYLGKEPEVIGYDFFGNEYYEGEELLKLDDEVFLLENLSAEAREILLYWGASRVEARK